MAQVARELQDLGAGLFAWTQLPGSWGWSNAGLITDGEESLLVDTLFDLELTAAMLAAMRDASPAAQRIGTVAMASESAGCQQHPAAVLCPPRAGIYSRVMQ